MTTFLPAALLLLAALVIVVAQKPPCMRKKQLCVSNAVCKKNGKKCRCPRRTRGNPLFACVQRREAVCLAIGDPTLEQFPRSSGKLFLPCRHHLSQYNTTLLGAQKACNISVFGTSELQKGGSYFENELELCFSIGFFSIYFRINKSGVSRTTDENGFRANGRKWITTPLNETLNLHDGTVHVSMDIDRIVNVKFCGSVFKFRPSTPGENPQKRVPGIGVTLTAPELTKFPFDNPTLCSTPQNTKDDLKEAAKALGLSIDEYLLYFSLKFAPPQNRGEFKVECALTSDLFKKCAPGNQTKAVKKCIPLLENKELIDCIQNTPTVLSNMNLFLKCVSFYCTNDLSACEAVRRFTFTCRQSKELNKLNCRSGNANP